MDGYLLDNNHLSAAISRVSTLRERIYQAHRKGSKLGACLPVLCELESGIQQTADPESYRRRLRILLKHVRIWPLEHAVARHYGEIYVKLRRMGRALSQVDM